METLTKHPELENVTFEYGFSTDQPLYVTIPMRGVGHSVAYKAKHTGGNCYVTGSAQSYGEVPADIRAQVPVIRFDKAEKSAILEAQRLSDEILPYVKNPGYYEGTLRGYLQAVEAAGVPVEYPQDWSPVGVES